MTTPADMALSYPRVFVWATTSSVYEFLGRDTSWLNQVEIYFCRVKDWRGTELKAQPVSSPSPSELLVRFSLKQLTR